MRQEYPGSQTGWAYKQSFKLDLAGERDGVLSTGDKPGAAEILESNRKAPVNLVE